MQLLVEAFVLMSWRAAVGGEAIPQTVRETASAVSDRLAATQSRELRNTCFLVPVH